MPKLRGMGALVALAVGVVLLAGCDPNPGEGIVFLRWAVDAETQGGTLVCEPPFHRGDNAGPVWTWSGDVGGARTTVFVGWLTSDGSLSTTSVDRGADHWSVLDYPLWPDPPDGISLPPPNPYTYDATTRAPGILAIRAVLPPTSSSASRDLLKVDLTFRCPT